MARCGKRPTTNDCLSRENMKPNSKSKTLLALVLAITIAATGCSAQWISLASDLPVLTQMALNVATLVSTLVSGPQASAADVAVIQNVSAQANRDLSLVQSLYSEYKANPNAPTLQKSRTLFLTSIRICWRCCSRHTLGTQCCQRASRLR
jgi:hypothetical protein